MRLAIFGTSNGIIRDGYLAALRAGSGIEVVQNLSLGASPIDFFAYRYASLRPDTVDCAVLESAVNDAACCRAGTYTPQRMVDGLVSAISMLRKVGVEPIGFVVPPRNRDSWTSAVLTAQAKTFRSEGVAFFDGERIFQEHASQTSVEYEALFRDAAHPISDVVRSLTEDFIGANLPLSHSHPNALSNAEWEYRFTDVTANGFEAPNGLSPRLIRTNLIQGSVLDIGCGDTVNLRMPQHDELIALVLSIRSTSAYLQIDGATSVTKNAVYEQDPDDTKIVVSPLLQPICPEDGVVRLTPLIRPPGNVERSYFTTKGKAETGLVSICGYISRRRTSVADQSLS